MPSGSSLAPRPDLCRFLDGIGAAGLLPDHQLARLADKLPTTATTVRAASRWILAESLLTEFQLRRCVAGKAKSLVVGQFVILEPLGRSAAGTAYKARHRAMDRLAVVKVLVPELTRTPADRSAVRSEVRAAARLIHPNVVTVLDVGRLGDRYYLVRDYVDGSATDAVVRGRGRMPVQLACDVALQTALGLQHAHDQGLAHGSVGPANVILGWETGGPVVKLTNFGLGRLTGLTAGAARPGTGADPADYLAPERTAHPAGPATPAADLYSLGATLFYLLAGEPPFPGGGPGEKVERHRFATPPDLAAVLPDVPPAAAALVRDLLAKHPAHRPATAAAVAARLQLLVEPGVAPPAVAVPPSGLAFVPPPAAPSNPWTGIGASGEYRPAAPQAAARPKADAAPKGDRGLAGLAARARGWLRK